MTATISERIRAVERARARAVGAMGALRERAGAHLHELGERARAESPRRRVAWGAIAIVLVLLPVAFNAARDSSFTASVEIFPRAVPSYPVVSDPQYFGAFVTDPHLQGQMAVNAGAHPGQYRDASFKPTPTGTVIVSLSTRKREDAPRLLNVLAPQIVGASGRQLAAQIAEEVALLRSQIRYQRLAPGERRSLTRRLRRLERLGPEPPDRAVLGAPASPPTLDRWADRFADSLPGAFPARPSPIWAGLAGLLLLAALWVAAVVFVPPARTAGRAPRPTRRRRESPVVWPIPLPRAAPLAILALAALAFVAIVMVVGRDLETFRLDEWNLLSERQGNALDDYLRPHNDHLLLVPVALFKGLFSTIGLEPYWPYRLMVAAVSVLLGVLVYLYARPRLGRGWALAPGVLAMLIGQGAYDVIWPFQISFNIAVACGVGILLCFDRPGPRSDLVAGALVAIALCSSSIGVAVAAAAVVDVLASPGRRRARALRVVALPLVIYAAWWLNYRPESGDDPAGAYEAIHLLLDLSGSATVGLVGAPISLRRPFAIALAAVVVLALLHRGPHRRELLVAASLPTAYWVLLILGRGSTGAQLLDSRYILPGSIFVACLLSEALRGSTVRARPWIAAVVALAVIAGSVNHVRQTRDIADFEVAARGDAVRAQAAALSVAGEAGPVSSETYLDPLQIPVSSAGRLLEAFGRYGDPVSRDDEVIRTSPAAARAAADRTYLSARALSPTASGPPQRTARCRTLEGPSTEVVVPSTGVALRASGRGPTTIGVRRWSEAPSPLGELPGRDWVRLTPGRDTSSTPVRARIAGFDTRVCS